MRSLMFLSVLIILSGLGYIGFSMLTYEPEVIGRYNINNIAGSDKEYTKEENKELSLTNQKKKDAIITLLKPAIENYNSELNNTPSQARNVTSSILNAIKSGALPILYPITNHTPSSGDLAYGYDYTTLDIISESISQVQETAEDEETSTAGCPKGIAGYIFGDTGRNKLSCTRDTRTKLRIYLGGPDNDIINARGNAIINGGSGNDAITAGPEFTMIFVEPNFGTDTININCETAQDKIQDSNADIIPWRYKFTHFIVFDSRVSKDDIVVSENSINNKATGDKILLSKNCFNIVYLSE